MSSYLFHSSPLPDTHYREPQYQATFLTPQASKTTPFTTWSSFQTQPPSPLRTSTFGNVMRSLDSQGVQKSIPFDMGNEDENSRSTHEENEMAHLTKPFVGSPTLATYDTTVGSTSATSSNLSVIAEPFATLSSTSQNRNPSQFQRRAYESTSTALISSRIANTRTSRKSDFLDRLRRSRRDAQDARSIETFEKAEYWRERKEREDMLRREALGLERDWAEDGQEETRLAEDDLSPVDEENEIEQLVQEWYEAVPTINHTGFQVDKPQTEGEPDQFMSDGFEDDGGYDEVFMEVLNQEQSTSRLISQSADVLQTLGSEESAGEVDVDMT